MKTALGVFMTAEKADAAIASLVDAGFDPDDISVLAHRDAVEEMVGDEREESAVESASAGALGGSAVGGLIGLIAGASVLVVPGVGPALAVGTWAGILGTAAAGAGVGAAYGGLVGALIGFGVAEEETHVYVEGVEKGGILLLVQPDHSENLQEAENIMENYGGIGVDVVQETDAS